ncbi:unnamed protein product [Zymoseptoria tritici ST99CH_1E4]|uniref:Uncharacterized protein n=1 Tax=Zymoseptoria tritici ST99CH_1E4 TaxID=1276532 RepID=A0A2H1H941_ZYMTR|nr:unnamed protein product [Zymoseptoria tritici ST99CH_1E4]
MATSATKATTVLGHPMRRHQTPTGVATRPIIYLDIILATHLVLATNIQTFYVKNHLEIIEFFFSSYLDILYSG